MNDDEKVCNSCGNGTCCIPCVIFGFKDLSSRVYILDAEADNYKINTRTMVAINRVFGGQMTGNLYNLDFVEPGANFKFRMYIYNLNIISGETDDCKREAVEAIKYLFKTLTTQGIFIGGRKSIGFGLIKLRNAVVKYYEKPDLLSEKSKKLEEVL